MTNRKTHYMASEFGTRAACGRYLVGWLQEYSNRWTADTTLVTCAACARHI